MDAPRLYGDLAWVWPLLSPPSDYPEEAEAIAGKLIAAGVPEGGRLLHLGCGGGSLDFCLKARFAVTGVDRSRAMLDAAAAINPEVEYVLDDMRECDLQRRFDAVLLHDAQAYLTEREEMRRVLATASRHLGAGGVLISAPEQLRESFRQHHAGSSTGEAPDGSAIVTTIALDYDADPGDRVFETTYIFVIRRGRHMRVEVDVHRKGMWDLPELLAIASEAGFIPEVDRPLSQRSRVLITARKGDDGMG